MADHTSKTPLEHRDSWRTPPALFAYFNRRFNFKADIAASQHNALCDMFYSEENSALDQDWQVAPGSYVWCNPPYSDIGPWIKQIKQQNRRGIGCAMLVPQDQSVGWFKEAIKSAATNIIITGGRIAFINAATGKAVGGNNKGSQVIVWSPYNDTPIATQYIDRDMILSTGNKIIEARSAA
ncbi:phage N-6-adenine-methyltransferase [Photobacterium phosphoreum]|uniref:phage N-6-adenine-methyltransferase n=1 Tax=Photobacterium phosphoreum TaxID=659 RepID=UPI001E5F65FB|nr:phage N-6-adenine-methyltransferase [Photobacterium phosphoreum]MCD9504570.1 phage N-6-adenine-methyltransferase [Photobacterium phosphoreum]